MNRSVPKTLDKSNWGAEALARLDALEQSKARRKAAQEAAEAHPLHGAWDRLTDEAQAASVAPRWRFVARDLGHGHCEAVVSRVIPNPERDLERAITPRGDGDLEANGERAARRAKQQVRLKCKASGIDSLWTLTYRANVTDRELVLRHFDDFRRRVAKLLGTFVYVAVLERQQRGAWHVHLGTHKLPRRFLVRGTWVKSWDALRAIWRRVVGELGGNFDEAKEKRRNGSRMPFRSSAGIARYIAAYIGKDMQDAGLNRKRYSASKGFDFPPPYRVTFDGETPLVDLITLAYAAVGERVRTTWFDAERGVFFIETEDPPPIP